MSKRSQQFKHTPKRTETPHKAPAVEAPDLTPGEAKSALEREILDECIRVEEGKMTIFPLIKLVRQYKELNAPSKSVL